MNPVSSCRTCLLNIEREQEPIKITDSMFEFLENILQLNKLPREHDRVVLPQNVCYSCFHQIMKIKRFYAQCKDAEEYLKIRLENALKIEEITEVATQSDKLQEYDDTTTSDCMTDDCLDVNFNESIIEYETEETSNYEEETIDEEESTLVVEYQKVGEEQRYNNNDKDEDQETEDFVKETLIKLENVEEYGDENDAIEIILDDIENEQLKEEDHSPQKSSPTNGNKTIRRKYNCKFCDKSFNSKSSLRSHEYIHSDARPYICEICGKAFRQSNILVTHMALHTGKKIECKLCGKKFARKSQMILHDRMHNDEKPFLCDYPNCNAAFRQNQYLIAHKETHTGVRRYQCTICTRTFFNRPSLLGHMHRVHGSIYYQCDMCERHFKKPQQIRNHMKSEHQIELQDVTHLKQRKSTNLDNIDNNA